MKKYIYTLLFCFCCFGKSGAQVNLVPNPSFEIITVCPYWGGALYGGTAPPWNSPSAGSPDLFSTCDTTANGGVPFFNGHGYQQPHTGENIGGGALYWTDVPEFKEYLQVQLINPLVAGRTYCASFYVNLANYSVFATSNIAMYFSDTNTYIPTYNYLNFTPQITSPTIVSDTANWTLITSQYTALGGEQYIMLGNFYPDNLTNLTTVHPGALSSSAYYYFDDVSIIDVTTPAYAGNDTSIHIGDSVFIGKPNESGFNQDCIWFVNNQPIDTIVGLWVQPNTSTTYILQQTICGNVTYDTVNINVYGLGINESYVLNSQFQIIPNPSNGTFSINFNSDYKDIKLEITNILGEKIKSINFSGRQLVIDKGEMQEGIYFVQTTDEKKNVINKKIIIQ